MARNEYRIPDGHTLDGLTGTLFSYLSSSDSELRDDIAYSVYANWLKRGMYSQAEIHTHVDQLLSNLDIGIGEIESDSVFLRSFSVLFLAEIVHNDHKQPLLDEEQITTIFEKTLWYLEMEKDPRGHIPEKGWAHALAHTADLILQLGKNRYIDETGLERLLAGIRNKLVRSTDWVYIHGEDDRLAGAVVEILKRGLVGIDPIKAWLNYFVEPEQSWKGVYAQEHGTRAFHNTRNFLRSLSEAVRNTPGVPDREQVQSAVFQALDHLKPY